jgi:haloalkane dehalogenase
MNNQDISPFFPYASHYQEVAGSRIHYIDEGSGHPILFLHGNPTSSYLWRNIIPYLTPLGRCIAPDLIGMGRSDKPSIGYRFEDHARYIEGFIHKMGLRHITLVLHYWGSALGFHYAMRHQENVRGVAFMEAILKTMSWRDFPRGFKMGFRLFRTPLVGWIMIAVLNMFVERIMPKAIVRTLTEDEKKHYGEPFRRVKDRGPVWRWPQEIPIGGKPADVAAIVEDYSRKLQTSDLPKLLFYGDPGGIIDSKVVSWCEESMKNLKSVNIGRGIHYLQEDNPHLIGRELADWYRRL